MSLRNLSAGLLMVLAGTQLLAQAASSSDKSFTFLTGPYPSKGLVEYQLDAGEYMKQSAKAAAWDLIIERDGKPIRTESSSLAPDGRAHGFISVGDMPDGAQYTFRALLQDNAHNKLAEKTDTFTRKVMPFESAARAGLSDILVPPFTPIEIGRDSLSCWARTYHHGLNGLMEQISAANQNLLARPAVFMARVGDGQLVALKGDQPTLAPVGNSQAVYEQTFRGEGISLVVRGAFDYDGFYKFTVDYAPLAGPVQLQDLRLEIPFKASVAQLIEASVTWRRNEGTQKECMGELDPRQGILWDSKTFPSRNWPRIGNMPPFFWTGDDDRGLVYSCASEQGMNNDENLAAANLERQGDEVIYRAWFVNKPLQLTQPRTFQFALQASPFKAMPENAHLWRNQTYRMPYKSGTLFTNWFTDGSYPTYGRFLTLDLLKKYAEKTGADMVGTMASAVSECGGTPEYLQFWHEWGSDLVWPKLKRGEPEPWAVKMLEEAQLPMNPMVRVESASNISQTNIDYRVWWFDQEVKHSGISYVYQDNPPYVYYYDPPNGYGYIRDDGRQESSSCIWNDREFNKRIATTAVENGKTDSPYLWLNAISPVIPGRSFSRKMLNGEYLYTKLFTLGQIRVMTSKQWGMVLDWYPFPQTEESPYPNIGPVRKYWREVFSRLLLHDITNFSGGDNAGYTERWTNALDLLWLEDPTVVWHPYYRNDTQPKADKPTTLISTYTAKGRALLFISNQSSGSVIENVHPGDLARFSADDLRYFYDAETGEQVETSADGKLKLFFPGMDYRVVIGFPNPWRFAAGNAIGTPDLSPQSTLDPEQTLTAIGQQFLRSPKIQPVPGAHRLYESWMNKVMVGLTAEGADYTFLDSKACSDLDFGKPGIQCSILFNKKSNALLVSYYNSSDEDVSLPVQLRDQIAKKAGKTGHNFIIHPVTGISEWELLDIPAHQALLEIYYSDNQDFWRTRRGPTTAGTMLGNIREAVNTNQRELGRRPLR